MTIINRQIRMARADLRWTQQELARKAQVSVAAVRRMEGPRGWLAAVPKTNELLRIIAVFQKAGLEFVNGGAPGIVFPNGEWVRLRLKEAAQ